jgi:hypothetical protein
MQPNLSDHPYFEAWRDPETGVLSYLLKHVVAPVQQVPYFTTPNISGCGEYLWFYAAFPPGNVRTIGMVSLAANEIESRHFPNAQLRGHYEHAVLFHAHKGKAGFFIAMDRAIYFFAVDGSVEKLAELSPALLGTDLPYQGHMACTLSLSCDGRQLLFAGNMDDSHFICTLDLQSSTLNIIETKTGFATPRRHCAGSEAFKAYTYSYFSPVEPDLFFVTGGAVHENARLWLMTADGTSSEPFLEQIGTGATNGTNHDFWSPDGWLCWTDLLNNSGVFEWNPKTEEKNHAWQRPACHAHCSAQRDFLVCDDSPYRWDHEPCKVLFYDRVRRQETAICSALPKPQFNPRLTHCHPHPRFVLNDSYVAYTTTVNDRVTVALTPTDQFG